MSVASRLGSRVLPGEHGLLVSESAHDQRTGTTAWVDEQLILGAKVFYKARPEAWESGDTAWLAGADGSPRTARAFDSGQLEIMDFAEVIRVAGGTTAGLRRMQADEVARGLDEGWTRVAMSQESASRPMADDDEIAEFTAQETGYDDLISRWPVTTLCQLTLPHENPAAVWETAALHSGRIVDRQWSGSWAQGCWWLRGELDVAVVARFGAALHGALRRCRDSGGDPALHVDASEVEFFDVASAQSLMLAAHAAARHQHVVVHGASGAMRDVIRAVGRPRTLLFAEDEWPAW